MPAFWNDVRYGLRMLAANPGFTAVAIVSLAVGIGANTSMFSLADAMLLRPLPVARPAEVVRVVNTWLQAKTVSNRATYVGQVDNLPPIVNRPIAGGPIAAGYHPAPQKYRAWLQSRTVRGDVP